MFKKFLLFVFLCSALFSKQQDFEIVAKEVSTEDDKIFAKIDVVVFNEEYLLTADKVVFDKESQNIELFGNVNIIYKDKHYTRSNYIKLNLKKDEFQFNSIFLYDSISDIWLKSKKAHSNPSKYQIDKAIISSCDVQDPDWRITFSEGSLDNNTSFITMKNAVFYAGGMPVFYLPYFKFSTDRTRRTGLLRPRLGYEKTDGLFYLQPIYFAPDENWDFEIDPQIRTNRGEGIYAAVRFVDTDHSEGMLRVGTFSENNRYYKEQNLQHDMHNGFEAKYERSKLLSDFLKNGDIKDGLLVDITYLNDIDYLNLQGSSPSKLVTSKVNYYLNRRDEYFGLYAKYFIDTEKQNNDDTLQTLPSFQYHKFSKNLFLDNLFYSVDYKYKNSYRKDGMTAQQHEISIPVSLHFSLLDDYLNFTVSENLYYANVNYAKTDAQIEDANYFSNYHKFVLSSDLTKKYEDFLHNMQLDLNYIIPSYDKRDGYFADFVPFNVEKKSLSMKVNQYFYDNEGFDFLTHRLSQSFYFDNDLYKYGDLENELKYRFSKDFKVSNTLFYSYEYDRISKIQSSVEYKQKLFDLKLTHTFQDVPNLLDINFLTTKVDTKLEGKYDFFASLDYDMKSDFMKEWVFGWKMKKRCWDYTISYKESVTPSLTSAGAESITKRGVYLLINLAPIGGINYKYETESSIQ